MNIYLGTFLIAFTTLAIEITLLRILSVITWYHLAFFAISSAMLGMTAGAITVYLRPKWFAPEKLKNSIAKACVWFALSAPICLILLCIVPIELHGTVMSLIAIIVSTLACSTPFYFSGIAMSAILTKIDLPIGKLYAADLLGASLGCIFVLAGLELLDAPSLIMVFGAIGVLAALCFTYQSEPARKKVFLFLGLLFLALINCSTKYAIRPYFVKGKIEDARNVLFEKWNSFSRVSLYHGGKTSPQYWGASPLAPTEPVYSHVMVIDGDAGTHVREFKTLSDIEHLKYDVTNIGYYLRPSGGAAIIGVGGGRDVQSAVLFGHKKIVGVDVNPVFIDLLKVKFKDMAGLANIPGVTLVADEGRSYFSRNQDQYSMMMMSLVDTWAATGAGAFSLTENSLYTVDAWQVFLSRLKEDGIFSVSRWYFPNNPLEIGRLVSLAMGALYRFGVKDPARHIAMVSSGYICTLIVAKSPFSANDLAQLTKVSDRLKYSVVFTPGKKSAIPELQEILSARSMDDLNALARTSPVNLAPPTDENPYFFNMLKLDNLSFLKPVLSGGGSMEKGNLIATLTLLALIVSLVIMTILTIVLPLMVTPITLNDGKEKNRVVISGVLYFSLIGAGFMLLEIGFVQRLSVLLGHPVYALGILLFTIILSTGIGSFISEKLPLTERPWVYIFPIFVSILILLSTQVLNKLLSSMITSSMAEKIGASIATLFPMGVVLGFFFPTGLKLLKKSTDQDMPWYWALNGIFGVLCSALGVFISIYFGISMNFIISSVCYGLVVLCLIQMKKLPHGARFVAASLDTEVSQSVSKF
ncbi:MAG: hypothetical protein FJ116_12100 [Deltaproteobacteria bacterium]|nr:hypothetical protein [Deltaproteobacteria bacterium]